MVKVLFLTGAGVSANAGLETYRSVGSSWTDRDLEKKSHASRYGNHLDELWDKHWGPMSIKMARAIPTYTHKAIADFQNKFGGIVVTQNVDTLHERAGHNNVVHVHGTMNVRCIRCKETFHDVIWSSGAPNCPWCGRNKTRPDVVLFGERINKSVMENLEVYARYTADVIIAIGTSLNVFPVANLVADNVTKSIIVNKQPTMFDKYAYKVFNEDCDIVIDGILRGLCNGNVRQG